MSKLDNILFNTADAFADDDNQTGDQLGVLSQIHIRIQQRSGRKSLTLVTGLAEDLDLKKILKALKKTYSTNGAILKDKDGTEVLQLQGDQRSNIVEFFVKYKICSKEELKVHGF